MSVDLIIDWLNPYPRMPLKVIWFQSHFILELDLIPAWATSAKWNLTEILPCGCNVLSSMEVLQLCWWRASSLFEPVSMDSDRKEWLETSWEKY